MPELPEVETIVRTLAPLVAGCRIVNAEFFSRLVMQGDPIAVAARLRDRAIETVARRGKFILLGLDDGAVLGVHLGMTGKLLWEGSPSPYTRAAFTLDRGLLLYDDIRQFGRIELSDALPARIARLGPDPLSLAEREFVEMVRGRRAMVKPLLLNQRFLGGLGNIYADEALFRAGIHPRAIASRLSRERIRGLYRAITCVLNAAIAGGGSSISDYVDGQGRKGSYQLEHQVYGRAGELCAKCGAAIRRIVLGQRGTHFCGRCQRR